ncbi:hypothetical protein MAJ_08466, partial [Metarhizium majus ARSEF 297]
MARPQKRKRQCSDEPADEPASSRFQLHRPVQKAKATEEDNFSPAFWDNLSKVWLTPRALRELDRRNKANPVATYSSASIGLITTNLARFARRGGPDLRHLRGYPEPKYAAKMSSDRSFTSSSRRTQSTKATTVSLESKRSSAYTKNFEQDLIDNKIYPEGYEYANNRSTPEPNNLDDIIQDLSNPRASLSPSRFSSSAFKHFKQANSRVISEGKVMSNILPTICGYADIPNEGNLPFTNLESITRGKTVDAVPDSYDGAHPQDIHKKVRQNLSKAIIPTNHDRAPVAPNFFVEAKAPRGGADVAKRQVCLDGAVGLRAMHALQNYGEAEPTYDGNAYAFSSTYHDGQLKLFAHHATAPTQDGRPEYHMTQLKGYALTSDRETFVAGATAFRNARDLAQSHRNSFIKAANTRASQAGVSGRADVEAPDEDPTYDPDSVNHDSYDDWQDADEALQQHVAETSNYAAYNDTMPEGMPQYLYSEDDYYSQELSQDSDGLGH